MTIIASPDGEGLLTSYDDLIEAVTSWLHRKDLRPNVPTFIALAEARINRIAQIRAMEIEVDLFIEAGTRSAALPVGYSSPLGVWSKEDQRRQLMARTPEALPVCTQAGQPTYWCIDGATLAVDCPAEVDREVTLRYRGIFRLGVDAPSNVILIKYPDLYLYGALMEAAMFIRDMEGLSAWKPMFAEAVAHVNRNESRARAAVPLQTELAGLLGRERCGYYGGYE